MNLRLVATLASALAVAGVVVTEFEPAAGDKRLVAYADVGGIPTVCDGHTKGVSLGMRVTHAQCDAWRDEDLREAQAIVDRCITAPMNRFQRGAFVSFAFNVGAGAKGVKDGLCWLRNGNQPHVRRMANQGRWREACDGLLAWTKVGGKEYPGLVRRRQFEWSICLMPDFSSVVGTVQFRTSAE